MIDGFYVVDLPYAYGGVEVQNGHVVGTPPILRWAIEKPALTLHRWVESKGGSMVLIGEQLVLGESLIAPEAEAAREAD